MKLSGNAEASMSIHHKLSQLSKAETQPFIYKVHKPLRNINPKAYEPDIIAIGPYHHGKDDLQMMEEHKVRYLESILEPKKENVERYISTLGKLEQKARDCYAEPIRLKGAEFVEMLVLDGCFIIELIRRYFGEDSDRSNDPIFKTSWMLGSIKRDLILFENQIPFFVLCELYDLIVGPDGYNDCVNDLLNFVGGLFPVPVMGNRTIGWSSEEVKHLLDLFHRIGRPPSNDDHHISMNEDATHSSRQYRWIHTVTEVLKDLHHLFHSIWRRPSNDDRNNVNASHSRREPPRIHNVTELKNANVEFRERKSDSIFEVKFEKGTIQIPPLTISDSTECLFRNLIAYEQYFPCDQGLFVTDYQVLMDGLINSSRDVEILSQRGIINNLLGDNEVVANLFNRLGDSVTYCSCHFAYDETFRSINTHYEKRWNKAWAVLNQHYFNSPWAYISFFAALLLLLLTVAQTVFSGMQTF